MASAISERLYANGHDVTMFAAVGSQFSGSLVTPVEPNGNYHQLENKIAHAAYEAHKQQPFDVFLDHSHIHGLAKVISTLPIVNMYHDRWQPWSKNAVVCSRAQKERMAQDDARFDSARVIHHQLNASAFTPCYRPDPYLLYLGVFRNYKQPILAIEAAARIGMTLKIVGGLPYGIDPRNIFSGNENAQYIGVLDGEAKHEMIRGATALLQFGTDESFGLTTVEAGLCGTPVVAWPSGGQLDIIRDGVNGVFIKEGNTLEAIHRARTLSRKTVREYTAEMFGRPEVQTREIEQALRECIAGWDW